MTIFMLCIATAGGYVASIYTWDSAKGIFMSTEARLKALEAKAAALKAAL